MQNSFSYLILRSLLFTLHFLLGSKKLRSTTSQPHNLTFAIFVCVFRDALTR